MFIVLPSIIGSATGLKASENAGVADLQRQFKQAEVEIAAYENGTMPPQQRQAFEAENNRAQQRITQELLLKRNRQQARDAEQRLARGLPR
jgi:hypothetical protein